MTKIAEPAAGDVDRQAEPARRRGADLWWAVPGALVAAAVFYVAHRGLVDDAYITLSYARNVAEHLHWGMIPAEESNTATSPLNVMMLAVATWITAVTGELQPAARSRHPDRRAFGGDGRLGGADRPPYQRSEVPGRWPCWPSSSPTRS